MEFYKQKIKYFGLFSTEKQMLRENMIGVYNYIKILFELKDSFGTNRNKLCGEKNLSEGSFPLRKFWSSLVKGLLRPKIRSFSNAGL